MTPLLSRLSPALEPFTAVVFTNKSTYHLPSVLPDFTGIVRTKTSKDISGLPSCLSTLSSNMDTGGPSRLGGPSDQGSQGNDDSKKKGKEREDPDRFRPDPSKECKGDGGSETPGPDDGNDKARNAQISFQVTSQLCERTAPGFQDLQVRGVLTIEV